MFSLVKSSISKSLISHRKIYTSSVFYTKTDTGDLNSPENLRKMKFIKSEMAYLNEQGKSSPDPSDVPEKEFSRMLTLSTMQRVKYYRMLNIRVHANANEKAKSELKSLMIQEREDEEEESNHIRYGIGRCSLFPRIRNTSIDKWKNMRVFRELILSNSNLVFDLSFGDKMSIRETKNVGKQLRDCFGINRETKHPYYINFTNAIENSILEECLRKNMPTLFDPTFPATLSNECFSKLFPKKQLIYLTPDSENIIENFNVDDIFVIGAIVDKSLDKPLTFTKAKRMGIRSARFPIDKYVQWKQGTKSLTLLTVLEILLEFKKTGNMQHALLKCLPKRKYYN